MGTVSSAKSSVASPSSCWSARAGPYSTGLSALAQRWRLQVASTPHHTLAPLTSTTNRPAWQGLTGPGRDPTLARAFVNKLAGSITIMSIY